MRKVMHHKNPKFQYKPKNDSQLQSAYMHLNSGELRAQKTSNILKIFSMPRVFNLLRMLQRRVSI